MWIARRWVVILTGLIAPQRDLPDVTGVPHFLNEMAAFGFSPEIIGKVAGGNFYRFLKEKFTATR